MKLARTPMSSLALARVTARQGSQDEPALLCRAAYPRQLKQLGRSCRAQIMQGLIASMCEQGRAMERLAEDRKGPSSMEHKKKQMVAALETNLKVRLMPHPRTYRSLQSIS